MANESIINPHLTYEEAGEHGKNHASLASHRRREQEIDNMVWEWRTDQVEHLEKRMGYVERDQFVPWEWEHLQEVRDELRGLCE